MGHTAKKMRRAASLLCGGFVIVVAACTQVLPPRPFTATIERVDDPAGAHYFPNEGHQPLISLYLRIKYPNTEARSSPLRIDIADIYDPAVYGSPGEAVEVSFHGQRPPRGGMLFSQLRSYRVIHRRAERGDN